MSTRRLSKDSLQELGAKSGFQLEGEELEAVEEAVAALVAGFEFVEALDQLARSVVRA